METSKLNDFLSELSALCAKHRFGLATTCGENTIAVFTDSQEYEGLSVSPTGRLSLFSHPDGEYEIPGA